MTKLIKTKKPFQIIMDILEIYIPSSAILLLFMAFILQIFSRYILKSPLVWPYEVAQISYVTAIMLGACYSERSMENIMFTVLYDKISIKLRKVCDILCSILVIGFLFVSIPSVVDFYRFFMTRYSVVLKIPLGLVYLPYLPFLCIMITRFFKRLVHALRTPASQLYANSNTTDRGILE